MIRSSDCDGAISISFFVFHSVYTWVRRNESIRSERGEFFWATCAPTIDRHRGPSRRIITMWTMWARSALSRRWRATREAASLCRCVRAPRRRPSDRPAWQRWRRRCSRTQDDENVPRATCRRWLGVDGRAFKAMWGSSWTTPRPGTRLAPGRRDAVITRGIRNSVRRAGSVRGRSWACSRACCDARRRPSRIRPSASRTIVRSFIRNAVTRTIIKSIIASAYTSVLGDSGRSKRRRRDVATLTSPTADRPRILIITLIRRPARRPVILWINPRALYGWAHPVNRSVNALRGLASPNRPALIRPIDGSARRPKDPYLCTFTSITSRTPRNIVGKISR